MRFVGHRYNGMEAADKPINTEHECETRSNQRAAESFNIAVIGFWSSLAFAVTLIALNLSFAIMVLQMPFTEWQGMEDYSRIYRTIAFVPQIIGLALIPAFVLMMASIHLHATASRKIWSMAGLAFGTASITLLGSLYFIQVGIVLPALISGDWQGLDQYAFANPRSIAWGLNHLAWSLLGAALFLMAWVFDGAGLRRWIRWLLVLNGLANIMLIFAFAFESEALTLAVAFLSWVFALPLAAVLVALMFKRSCTSTKRMR